MLHDASKWGERFLAQRKHLFNKEESYLCVKTTPTGQVKLCVVGVTSTGLRQWILAGSRAFGKEEAPETFETPEYSYASIEGAENDALRIFPTRAAFDRFLQHRHNSVAVTGSIENEFGPPLNPWRELQDVLVETTETQEAEDSRGGFEAPLEREIPKTPPSKSSEPSKVPDPEAGRVELERRIQAHYRLLRAFADKAETAGLRCICTQYADALCQSSIFEMKSIEKDEVAQARAAVGQLYHYLFIHRELPGFEKASLYAVFDKVILPELLTFLREVARVGVIIFDGARFSSDERTMQRFPWLFSP